MENTLFVLKIIIGLTVGVLVYFLPSIVASRRGTTNVSTVLLLDAFLGWTLIGWIVAMALALGGPRASRT